MLESAIMHEPESKYCYAIDTNKIALRIRIAKDDNPKISVIYGGKYSYSLEQKTMNMERAYEDRLFAYYTCVLKLTDCRLVYIFEIDDHGEKYYYSEDGLSKEFDFNLSFYNCFQYSYINECDIIKTIDWMKSAVFYQIFVDRFAIGNLNKDMSYINMDWKGKPTPKSFAGGDLRGIINRLQYLKNLGINAIYLTPIFKSISNHKYDISDYLNIDEAFGNKEDLHELINKAHSLGIRIVLDAVFNHCSENIMQFQDVLAKGRSSKYYDWFIITNDNPLDYECFAACKYMPKLNTSNKEVQSFLMNVGTYWIKEFDIDGWRLDVSDEVSHNFWRKFREKIKECKRDAVLIGENWHDANVYLRGDQYDSIMNYAFTKAALDFYAFGSLNPLSMAHKLNGVLMRNSDNVNHMMLNLLDCHDTLRFYTEVKKNENKLISALALLFMYPGAPCVYYGTEVPLEGGYDPDSRRCIDWKHINDNLRVSSIISKLAEIKKIVKAGNVRIYSKDNLLIIDRFDDENTYRLLINNNSYSIKYKEVNIKCSNLYQDGYILGDGFVIDKIS